MLITNKAKQLLTTTCTQHHRMSANKVIFSLQYVCLHPAVNACSSVEQVAQLEKPFLCIHATFFPNNICWRRELRKLSKFSCRAKLFCEPNGEQ